MQKDSYNLNDYDFYKIWNDKFKTYRNAQQNHCAQIKCPIYNTCKGHCPYYPTITTCYVNKN
jgi:radical SAM protein with 4Fe4S-binding SPASM domain